MRIKNDVDTSCRPRTAAASPTHAAVPASPAVEAPVRLTRVVIDDYQHSLREVGPPLEPARFTPPPVGHVFGRSLPPGRVVGGRFVPAQPEVLTPPPGKRYLPEPGQLEWTTPLLRQFANLPTVSSVPALLTPDPWGQPSGVERGSAGRLETADDHPVWLILSQLVVVAGDRAPSPEGELARLQREVRDALSGEEGTRYTGAADAAVSA